MFSLSNTLFLNKKRDLQSCWKCCVLYMYYVFIQQHLYCVFCHLQAGFTALKLQIRQFQFLQMLWCQRPYFCALFYIFAFFLMQVFLSVSTLFLTLTAKQSVLAPVPFRLVIRLLSSLVPCEMSNDTILQVVGSVQFLLLHPSQPLCTEYHMKRLLRKGDPHHHFGLIASVLLPLE